MSPTRARRSFLLAALAVGCSAERGDLDPEVIRELSRTPGSAVGFDASGDYVAELEIVECTGCDAILELAGQGTCSLPSGTTLTDVLEVVQSDGVLLMDHRDVAAVGPIDADGRFALGSLADLSSPFADVHVALRVDGELDDDPSPGLHATVRQRTHGRTTAGVSLDCRETFEMSAVRLSPP